MLETIDKAVRILRRVRRLKASSITVTKLAHDIELVPMSGGSEISTAETQAVTKETEVTWSDKKRRAVIQYVAKHIGPDWPSLFYSLPFSPPRGRLELEAMATRLMRSSPRGDHTVLAHNALNQWCQMNLTADPQMLCQTLMRIHRVQLAKWVCRKCKMQFSEAISKKTVEWISSGGRKTVVTPTHLTPISSSELHPSSSPPSALTLAINRLIAKSTGQDHMRDLSTDEGTTNTKTLPNYFKWYGLPVAMKTVRKPKPIVNGSTSKNEREVPNNCDVTVSSLL
ncbi:unnamed protein product [Dicrocoelium dendriticum]|nr:unnamed protein product [Dicrocoelium dendriticum]